MPLNRPDGLTRLLPEQMAIREDGTGNVAVARHVTADGYHHWETFALADLPDDLDDLKAVPAAT